MEGEAELRILEVDDERTPLAVAAISLIESTFDPRDRHTAEQLHSEIAEKRLGLLAPFDYHLLVAELGGELLGAAIGTYLAGVDAGFVNYLAVVGARRGQGTGRLLRAELVRCFRADAARAGYDDLAWVLGEVRLSNPWLQRLVRSRRAIPFDLTYFHPGMRPGAAPAPYVLYRQPTTDLRVELPVELVRRILFAIYRRAYRVRYPLQHEGFQEMLRQLDGREAVGAHPAFELPGPG